MTEMPPSVSGVGAADPLQAIAVTLPVQGLSVTAPRNASTVLRMTLRVTDTETAAAPTPTPIETDGRYDVTLAVSEALTSIRFAASTVPVPVIDATVPVRYRFVEDAPDAATATRPPAIEAASVYAVIEPRRTNRLVAERSIR